MKLNTRDGDGIPYVQEMHHAIWITITFVACLCMSPRAATAEVGTCFQAGTPDKKGPIMLSPAADRRRVAPVHDVITPSIPLAVKLPGGPIKMLAIATESYGRWPLEVEQRLDVDLSVVYAKSEKTLGYTPGSIGMRNEDIVGRLLQALNEQPDVIVSNVRFDAYPEEVQKRLLALIASGTGYIGHLDKMDKTGYSRSLDAQRDLFTSSVPYAEVRALTNTFETVGEAAENAFELYENAQGHRLGTVWAYPRDDEAPDPSRLLFNWMPRMEEEAWNSFLCKTILWCARRDDGALTVDVPQAAVNRNDLPLPLAVKTKACGEKGRIEVVVYDRDARERHSETVAVKEAQATPPLPLLPAGDYILLVRLWDGEVVRDWSMQALKITAPVEIAKVTTADHVVEHDAPIEATIELSAMPEAGSLLRVETLDNFGRIVQRQTVVPTNTTMTVRVPTIGSRHLYNYVNVQLCEADNGVEIDENRAAFIIRHPDISADELTVKMWTAVPPAVRNWQIAWKNAMDGVDLGLGDADSLAPYNMRAVLSAAWMSKVELVSTSAANNYSLDKIKENVAKWKGYPVFQYILGDDFHLAAGWNETAKGYLVDWAKDRYGEIGRLNQAWNTDYAEFADIKPIAQADALAKPDYSGLCQWVDQELARADLLIEFIGNVRGAVIEVDPHNRVGLDNTIRYPGPKTGFNYIKLARTFDNVGTYWNPITADVYRMARAKGSRQSIYSGAYGQYCIEPYYAMEMCPWWSVFNNLNGQDYWMAMPFQGWAGVLAPDLGPLHGYGKSLEGVHELKAGIAKLLLNAERKNDRIAVLYSQGSIEASAFLGGTGADGKVLPLPKPEQWSGVDAGADQNVYMNAYEGFTALLRDIGYSYDCIFEDGIQAGDLTRKGVKVLVLPLSLRLEDKTVEAIREFVRDGGAVVADFAPGLFDDCMRPTAPGSLRDVFGVAYAGGVPQTALEPAVLDEQANTVIGADESSSMKGISSLGTYLSATNVELTEATALAHNSTGSPLLAIRNYGKGKAIFLNMLARDYQVWRTLGEEMSFRQTVAEMLKWAGLAPEVTCSVQDIRPGKCTRPLQATGSYRFVQGEAEYVGILRDFALRMDETVMMSDLRVQPTTIDFGREAHVYDIRRGVYRGYRRTIDEMIAPARAELYALLPYEVDRLDARADFQSQDGKLNLQAQLLTIGDVQPGQHVIHIEVTDPQGRRRPEYAENCLTEHGDLKKSIRLGYNPDPGVWTLTLKDVASGAKTTITFAVSD